MEPFLYDECQSLRWLTPLLILAILAAAIGIAQTESRDAMDLIGFAFMVATCGVAVFGFRHLRTRVTPAELRFGFPIWRKRFPLSAVQVGAVVPLTLWHGIGIHFTGKTWVYNAHLGRAVEIHHRGTRYLIGSRDPERLQSALLHHTAPRVRV